MLLSLSPYTIVSEPYRFLVKLINEESLIKIVSESSSEKLSSTNSDYFLPSLRLADGININDPEQIFKNLSELITGRNLFKNSVHEELPNFREFSSKFNKAMLKLISGKLENSQPEQFTIELGEVKTFLDELEVILSGSSMTASSVTMHELLTFYSLNALEATNSLFFQNHTKIRDFLTRIKLNPLVRDYYFSKENILRKTAPNLFQENHYLLGIAEENVKKFIDFAIMKNVLYFFQKAPNIVAPDHAPFSVLPMIIEKDQFSALNKKQKLWLKVINKMSRDTEWLFNALDSVAQNDEFVRRLILIAKKVLSLKERDDTEFFLLRNDFMYDSTEKRWMQIEYNSIAVSFGPISEHVHNLHELLLNSHFKGNTSVSTNYMKSIENKNTEIESEGFIKIFNHYNNKDAKVLLVCDEWEGNVFDQRFIEMELAKHGILTIRRTFIQIHEQMRLDESSQRLFIGKDEIAIVYFRSGYQPHHYKSEKEWEAREKIELSKAVKVPSVFFQLSNFKKLQEVLQDKKELRRFVDNEEEVTVIQENFARIWGLDDVSEHEGIKKMVSQNPDNFVLKPQREGGGNNFYGDSILEEFEKLDPKEIATFILMQRIKPCPRLGFLVKQRGIEPAAVISELGLYSYMISDKNGIKEDNVAGYLLRTKKYLENEGGVATGYSVLDSLCYL